MKRIVIPTQPHDIPLPFYLAVEEWVAKNLPAGKYFFAWQVDSTVICGRHQDIPAEVDLEYASRHNIYVCRRKSGGGSVYADRSNVMFSYITPSDAVQITFSDYTSMICQMLGSLGINAVPTGRNDISVNDKKVAGNAFFKIPGRSIVHGTMLYDADFETVGRVLTPSRAKMVSKGVVSVPSRITTLRAEGLKISCREFIDLALEYLCDEGEYVLTHNDLAEINEILRTYLDPDFLKFTETKSNPTYIDGVGEIVIDLQEDEHGMIKTVGIKGDFFPLKDVGKALNDRLIGLPNNYKAIQNALEGFPAEEFVAGLTDDKFRSLISRN